jgi:hypothetical protein
LLVTQLQLFSALVERNSRKLLFLLSKELTMERSVVSYVVLAIHVRGCRGELLLILLETATSERWIQFVLCVLRIKVI